MDKKHICFVCHEYPPAKHGGIGSFTKDIAEELVKNNYKVTVIGFYVKNDMYIEESMDERINEVRVIRYPRSKKFKYEPFNTLRDRILLYNTIKNINKQNTIDIVEAPGGSGWLPLGTPGKLPLVTRLHGGEVYTAYYNKNRVSKITYFFEKYQIKHSKKVIAVSNFIGNKISELLKEEFDFKIIYNSVSKNFQNFNGEEGFERGLIVFAGTLRESKGIDTLIKASVKVFEKIPYAHLKIAGRSTILADGKSYEEKLYAMLPQKYHERVEFAGTLDRDTELISFLSRAQICCFPSYFEAFSLLPIEAAFLKKAVVYTRTTSGSELFEDGHSALLVDPTDSEQIANALIVLLEDDNRCKKLGENAYKHVVNNFSFDKWIEENISLYEDIIYRRKS